jgi:hypothetical protein
MSHNTKPQHIFQPTPQHPADNQDVKPSDHNSNNDADHQHSSLNSTEISWRKRIELRGRAGCCWQTARIRQVPRREGDVRRPLAERQDEWSRSLQDENILLRRWVLTSFLTKIQYSGQGDDEPVGEFQQCTLSISEAVLENH